MNILAFVTYNIEPPQWLNFAYTAAVKLPPKEDSPERPLIPYVLVSSASASADYFASTEATERLDRAVETELADFTRRDVQSLFKSLVNHDENHHVHSLFFVVLDADSARDSKALVVQRDLELVDEEGNETELWRDDPRVTELTVWRWHRVPFEKVWDNVGLMSTKGRMWDDAEEYLEENIIEDASPVPQMET